METDNISRVLAQDPLMCHYEVVAKDTLPEVVSTYPSVFVCYTHDNDQPGEHWVAMNVDEIGDYFLRPERTKTATCRVHELYERTLLAVVAQRSYAPEPYIYYLWSILRRFLNVSLS